MANRIVGKSALVRIDETFGGPGKIVSTVDELGVAGQYRVVLHHRTTGIPIAQTFSDPVTGAYSFENLRIESGGYYAVAFDHGNDPLNAAIADLLTPEPMG